MCKYCFKAQTGMDPFGLDDLMILCGLDCADNPITGSPDSTNKS